LRPLRDIPVFLEAIKVSHSVFALPFAVAAAFMAQMVEGGGLPPLGLLGKIVLAAVAARTAAMSFNRFADAALDRGNPRTAGRAVPSGQLSRGFMLTAALLSSAAFAGVAWWINSLAFALSPVALLVLLGYSYTKRFTSMSHLVLGAALGLSPLGAWVAMRAELAVVPALLGAAVLFWTGGFDIIYACQDVEADRRQGLFSLPRRLGLAGALLVSRLFHLLTAGLLVSIGILGGYGVPYYVGVAVVAFLLAYEQCLVSPRDLSRVNVAFFSLNGLVSLFFMAAVVVQAMVG
jgi:4-hydroxybenzoate polyprenyltransferase